MIMEALTNEQISALTKEQGDARPAELSDDELEKVAGGVKLSDFMPKSFLDYYRSYKSAADTDDHARQRLIEYDKLIYEKYASFCASKGLDADPSKLIFDY